MSERYKGGNLPVPAKLLESRGSWRAKARKETEPEAEIGVPEPPEGISHAARAKWLDLVPQLEAMGIVANSDQDCLYRYCETWVLWSECKTKLAEEDTIFVNDKGNLCKNPRTAVFSDLSNTLHKLSSVLGLSPVDRARVKVDPARKSAKEEKSTSPLKLKVS